MSLLDPYFLQKRSTGWTVVKESRQQNLLKPNGVSSTFVWPNSGRVNQGLVSTTGYYITPWGQVHKASGATVSADVLIKIRNIEGWAYSLGTGLWTKVVSQFRPIGFQYPEDFNVGAVPAIAPVYYSSDPNAIIVSHIAGRSYHFFPSVTKPEVDSEDTGALITVFEAKLISKTGADISAEVGTLIASTGFDWWSGPTAEDTNSESFIGSYKPITTSFSKFYGTTMRLREMVAYGVPSAIDQLTGVDSQTLDPEYEP